MQPHEIEAWALRAVERVSAGRPLEDSLVEAKAAWIGGAKAARRIAGHCNAARGSPVLWVIGLDEGAGTVPGATPTDPATWWPQVLSHFDGPAPRLTDLVVHAPGGAVVLALLFETDRAPFVVRNPAGGGVVSREVPWREGTAVRSATHADLVQILAPLSKLPKVELVEGRLVLSPRGGPSPSGGEGPGWTLLLRLFVTPVGERAVFPLHRTTVEWRVGSMPQKYESRYPTFSTFQRTYFGPSRPHPQNVVCTDTEAIVTLPGVLEVRVDRVAAADYQPARGDTATVTLSLHDTDADQPLTVEATLAEAGPRNLETLRFETLPHGVRLDPADG